jgi:uncharacterized protein (TIGR03437 family)
MRLKSPLMSFLFLCAFGVNALAATYYVATNGNDANAGTNATAPLLTIQAAVNKAAPGDTIIVKAGTYAGFRVSKSGTASAPITIKGEMPGARPVLNRAGTAQRHEGIIEVESFSFRVAYIVIENFEVTNGNRHGIDLRETDFVTVRNCYSHHNGKVTLGCGILLGFCSTPLLENNECSFNSEHGIYQGNTSHHPTVRGNSLHDNARAGLHVNGDLSLGGGMANPPADQIGIVRNALIEKNVIYNNGAGGGSGINCDGIWDSIIRNNLLYANKASGISLYGIDAAKGASRNQVYHNTIVMPSNSRWALNIAASTNGQPHPIGNVVRNNILYHAGPRGSITTYSTAKSVLDSNYNIVVNVFSVDNANSFTTFAAWKAAGQDANSKLSTPVDLFVNAAANDFKLKSTSPALNAGIAVSGATDDLAGVTRPQGSAPDIGCYETPGTAPPPPAVVTCVNAASYSGAALAANSIVAGFGANLANATVSAPGDVDPVTPGIQLPTTLAVTTVSVTDATNTARNAPLFFVSPNQVNFMLPAGTALGVATVRVTNGSVVTQGMITVEAVAPGLFTANANGQGVPACVALRTVSGGPPVYENIAALVNGQYVATPIDLGPETNVVYLVLYGTGWRGRTALSAVTATIGGTPAGVSFAGAAPGFVGLDQLNVQIPRSLIGRGAANVAVTVNGKTANVVSINLK